MDAILTNLGAELFFVSLAIAVFAGVIKGMVGFGMPMVLVSGLSTFLSPEWALAGLILPTIVSNWFQALRQGPRAAMNSVVRFRTFLIVGAITLVISAQFVRLLPQNAFLLVIGLPVTIFAAMQLLGVNLRLARPSFRIEAVIGAIAGLIGGVSGVWGPPTVAYLTALDTEKTEQVRVQGVIYGLGAVLLFFAHIGSGVLRGETALFSAMLLPPAILGMWFGGRIHNRIDQTTFRKATLVILTLAGLNLIRRALFG
ncbi:sulfite exporter TauE/SafE family protein [Shimia sp.]|uniref:sulfite exporter TauE/SafE family protein n=1 Tax=Shimia sp. TaxID=1954381 RepID=UPI003296CF0E